MDLYVNGEKLDVTLENEKTVGDVLTSFEKTCEGNDCATIGIVINGEKITAEDFDKASLKLLTPDTKIELSVVAEKAIEKSFADLADNFTDLANKMEQIPIELQSGKDSEARKTITQLADEVDQFCHIATLSALFPQKYNNLRIQDKAISDFFADFSSILTDFENGLKSSDTVLIGDLAEYEIRPRLLAIVKALEVYHEY